MQFPIFVQKLEKVNFTKDQNLFFSATKSPSSRILKPQILDKNAFLQLCFHSRIGLLLGESMTQTQTKLFGFSRVTEKHQLIFGHLENS
jgi:hypothetical protein